MRGGRLYTNFFECFTVCFPSIFLLQRLGWKYETNRIPYIVFFLINVSASIFRCFWAPAPFSFFSPGGSLARTLWSFQFVFDIDARRRNWEKQLCERMRERWKTKPSWLTHLFSFPLWRLEVPFFLLSFFSFRVNELSVGGGGWKKLPGWIYYYYHADIVLSSYPHILFFFIFLLLLNVVSLKDCRFWAVGKSRPSLICPFGTSAMSWCKCWLIPKSRTLTCSTYHNFVRERAAAARKLWNYLLFFTVSGSHALGNSISLHIEV